jgi:hypothetical protein
MLPSFARAADLRVQTASAMQTSINFKTRIVPADDTSCCLVGEVGISPFGRQLGHAASMPKLLSVVLRPKRKDV